MEAISDIEMRDRVNVLVAGVMLLQSGAEGQQAPINALRAENQALRDEVTRLKRLPPRPPSRPSGMGSGDVVWTTGEDEKRLKLPRGGGQA